MRSGFNPNKDQEKLAPDYFHQVVIPIYIPNQTDYFRNSLAILKLSVDSLLKTCHERTFFTIVNNGSDALTTSYLDSLLANGQIHELIHAPNIGKVNAILKGVNGHDFDLVTITDADVLFKSGWQEATYSIFKAFPKAAAVSPVPIPTFLKYYNAHLWVRYTFSPALKFTPTLDRESLVAFQKSIANPNFYKDCHLDKTLSLISDNCTASVGSGHFVNTYRSEIFDPPAGKHSNYALGGDSETVFIDKPAFNAGGYRLATSTGFAYHMGNTLEAWMQETLQNQPKESQQFNSPISQKLKSVSGLKNWWVKSIFKLITRGPIWEWILRKKGLDAKAAKQY